MVKELQQGGELRYQCEECGFLYKEKEWAEKCEAWCREHQSCNLEIIQHGKPPENEKG
jgi:lipopolysaccharide biosynthesis regulator YciM